ncbi:MAG: SDR family NAD(P)-dependent oxidoreductase, partial [Gemmobacter sp.]
PVISNRTGRPLADAEATSPDYWVAHLRGTVLFADGIAHLAAANRVFLEVGPGRALASLAQANGVPGGRVLASLRHPDHAVPDDQWFVLTFARLWAIGLPLDWAPLWGEARRRRVPLPTYPFQRQRYFIEAGQVAAAEDPLPMRIDDPARWGWRPVWVPEAARAPSDVEGGDLGPPLTWLVFADAAGLADTACARLAAAGHRIVKVRAGDAFARLDDGYRLAPERGREDYDLLIRDLVARGLAPQRIAHFWLVTEGETFRPGSSFFHRNMEQGFWSLFFLGQAMAEENLPRPIHVTVVTTGAARVRGEALAHPEKAAVAGPARVMPRELPGLTCTTLDIALPPLPRRGREAALAPLAALVLEDMLADPPGGTAALRGGRRYGLVHRPVPLPDPVPPIAEGAAVLITGGFGGIGLTLAEHLFTRYRARIVLLARRALPPPEARAGWLRSHAPDDPVSRRILAVERLESLGAQVAVIAADVCNLEEMRAARAVAEADFGRIAVLIHAAGVIDDAPMLAKNPGQVEAVFAPKLHGTQVLTSLFPDGDLDLMVLFSSTSTVTAPAGQVDYVAANEFLNALSEARAGGRTRVVAIDWGVWSGVGMAADQIAERTRTPAAPVPAAQPLLDTAGFDTKGDREFAARWRAADRWVLDGHRTADGAALLPGTGYLELAAEALAAQGEAGPWEARDLTFFRPLAVPDGAALPVRVRLARSPAGYAFAVLAEATAEGRRGWQTHATA